MCKSFIYRGDVLCGPALKVVIDDYENVKADNRALNKTLKNRELSYLALEREVKLLRIIKRTLEMQSGMAFDI
jgi:hypothetical protein